MTGAPHPQHDSQTLLLYHAVRARALSCLPRVIRITRNGKTLVLDLSSPAAVAGAAAAVAWPATAKSPVIDLHSPMATEGTVAGATTDEVMAVAAEATAVAPSQVAAEAVAEACRSGGSATRESSVQAVAGGAAAVAAAEVLSRASTSPAPASETNYASPGAPGDAPRKQVDSTGAAVASPDEATVAGPCSFEQLLWALSSLDDMWASVAQRDAGARPVGTDAAEAWTGLNSAMQSWHASLARLGGTSSDGTSSGGTVADAELGRLQAEQGRLWLDAGLAAVHAQCRDLDLDACADVAAVAAAGAAGGSSQPESRSSQVISLARRLASHLSQALAVAGPRGVDLGLCRQLVGSMLVHW